jgi:2-polyprenyl-3-methyl-5-hydroxy-6-metoxy-1,4-benzoquinol methylase
MMTGSDRSGPAGEAELHAYYERGEERDRLAAGRGLLEFTRTTEIVQRRLPAAPALVADIGGGPGRYALWLAGLGYRVEHRDLVPESITYRPSSAGSAIAVNGLNWSGSAGSGSIAPSW